MRGLQQLTLGWRLRRLPARWLGSLLAASLLAAGLAPAASAIEPPPELRYVCVDRQSNVHQADSPGACGSDEKVFTLPVNRPFHMCADSLGRLRHVTSAGGCGSKETALTVPDSGTLFVCSENLRGGVRLPRGKLRHVRDVSLCERHESAFVTPAAPEAVGDSYTVDEDTMLDVPARGVLDNDRDLTGEPLRARLVTGPARGALALAVDGGFRFDPRGAFDALDSGQSATTTFTYVANDGMLDSPAATVTVTVSGRNDRPLARDDIYGTDEDTAVAVLPPGVLANDTDAEGHRLRAALVAGPARGALALATDGSFRFDPARAFEALDTGETATAAFTYRATDGTDTSDTATATVTVQGVNDAPVARPDALTTDENTPLPIARATLLANDSDAEGHVLEIRDGDVSPPDRGHLTGDPGSALVFDPRAAFDGLGAGESATATFTYRASETGAGASSAPVPVVITVTGISPPDAVDDQAATNEDSGVEINLFANDRLNGGRLASISLTTGGGTVTQTGTPGVVRYDPGAPFQGLGTGESRTDTFSYTLQRDGEPTDTAHVTVIVEGRNDVPVAAADGYSLSSPHQPESRPPSEGVLANDGRPDPAAPGRFIDVDGDQLTARLVAPPQAGRLTLRPDGSFTFDPAGELPDEGRDLEFSYRASDGVAESNTATVGLDVGTNVVPAFVAGTLSFDILTTDEDGIVGRVLAGDDDGDLPLTFRFTDADPLPFVMDPDGTIGLAATPARGTYTRAVEVRDTRGGTSTATVTIDVHLPLAAMPDAYRAIGNTELVAGGGSAAGVARGTVVASVAEGLLANDGGTDGEPVAVEERSGGTAKGGAVSVFADGSFVYVAPRPGGSGPWDGSLPLLDSFRYRILRHEGEAEEANVTVTVTDVVWYVDASSADPGNGTAIAPFRSLSSLSPADPAADDDAPGHVVFVRGRSPDATTYADGVALEDRQRLIGEGAGLSFPPVESLRGYELVPPGAEPVLMPPTGAAVRLAADNVVRGLAVESGGAGIIGGSVGNLQAALTRVVANNGAALLLQGTAAGAKVAVTTVRGGGSAAPTGVTLTGLQGSVALGSAELAAATGLHLSSSGGALSVGTLSVRGTTGLEIANGTGTVDVGELKASSSGTALAVDGGGGSVRVRRLSELAGGTVATAALLNATGGSVALDAVDLPALIGSGIRISANGGPVRVGGGRLGADAAGFQGVLMDVDGAKAPVDVAATLSLTTPTGPPSTRAGGRSVEVSNTSGAGSVSFTGPIVDHGAGIELDENFGGGVRFTGGMTLDTGSSVAFYAKSTVPLAVAGTAPNTLSSAGATALRLSGVSFGGSGVRFDDVVSADAPFVDGDPHKTGSGIDVSASGVSPLAPAARLLVVGGRVERSARAGVQISDSGGVTIGRVDVVESVDEGVLSSRTQNLVLQGVAVDRAGTDGVSSANDRNLLLDGVSVLGSQGRGVAVSGVAGPLTLRNTSVRRSQATQVHVVDDSTLPADSADSVLIEGTTVSDGSAEVPNVVVESAGASRLAVRAAGATASSSVGGLLGLEALARDGGKLNLDLTKLLVASSDSDGIRIHSRDTRDPATSPSAVTFSLADLGGVQAVGGNGIALETDGIGTMTGTIARVSIGGTKASGVAATQVRDVTLSQVTVAGFTGSGVFLDRSSNIRLMRVDVTGPPSAHGIELRNTRDIRILDSRVDLRGPVPPDAPVPPDDTAACRSRFDLRGTSAVPEEPLHAGIFARHVGGVLQLGRTVVRGATLHQVVVLNGADFPGGEIDDPGPAMELDGRLEVSGLTLLDTPHRRNGLLAGATTGGKLRVDLPAGDTSSVDAPLLVCAVDGGQVTGATPDERGVTGGPVISADGTSDVLVLKAAGAQHISYFPLFFVNPSTLSFLIDGLSVDFSRADPATATGRPFVAFGELFGRVGGELRNTTVVKSPGDGMELRGVSDLLVDGLTLVEPRGRGVIVADSADVELRDVVVERPAAEGLFVDGSTGIVVGGLRVDEPRAGGVVARDSTGLVMRNVTVLRPAGHAVEVGNVENLVLGVLTADFRPDADTPAPAVPASALFARHVGGGVHITGVTSTAPTAEHVVVVNGNSFPGVPDSAATETAATLTLAAVSAAGTPGGRNAVLVGAGAGGTLDVALAGTQMSTLDARMLFHEAGGALAVTGGFPLTMRGSGDAVLMLSPTGVALSGMSVAFADAVPVLERGDGLHLRDAGPTTIDRSAVSAARTGIRVEGGSATTEVRNTRVGDSVGHGLVVSSERIALDAVAVDTAGGWGVIALPGSSATLAGTTVTDAADGILLGAAAADVVSGSRIAVRGVGIRIFEGRGGSCVDVQGNGTDAAPIVFQFDAGVGLAGYQPAQETVTEWLLRLNNKITSVEASDVRSC